MVFTLNLLNRFYPQLRAFLRRFRLSQARLKQAAPLPIYPSDLRLSPARFRLLPRSTIRKHTTSSAPLVPIEATESASYSQPSPEPVRVDGFAQENPTAAPKREVPSYDITFTCRPCSHRSTHRISKQGYHKGSILITCPDCKNRHVISDHLKIFCDKAITVEDLIRQHGEQMKKGSLGINGDIEFWDTPDQKYKANPDDQRE